MISVNVSEDVLLLLVDQVASAVVEKLKSEKPASPEIPPERLALSPPDAAAALSISQRLLWDLTKAGRVRATKCGARTVYAVAELQRFLRD